MPGGAAGAEACPGKVGERRRGQAEPRKAGDLNRQEKGGKAQQASGTHRIVTNLALNGPGDGPPFSVPLVLSEGKLSTLAFE
ncbi:hypothetical protein DUI87_15580 [Hirundo rustica rustica]|uniref:Uncharacterized protein n=1 Tax=Hirundo rustica rustica TaxID=333673 RepID=A0A3M0K4Z7_HIRRU|nr:hypothetical protein DUI87_15580 [Hirundo rustica rustica]